MAKKNAKQYDPFQLALRQMTVTQLKKLASQYQKSTAHCTTRDDYVNRLAVAMTPKDRHKAMREFVLAGKTSMSIYAMDCPDEEVDVSDFVVDFNGTATREPSIVTVGEVGAIIEGQQLIQWAVVTGQQNFLDIHLALKEEPETIVVDTFYEPETGYLQIRCSTSYAKKIAMHWAKVAELDFEQCGRPIGLTTPQEVDAFATHLKGSFRKCGGDRKESQGMLRMSGTRHPNVADLRGTPDYINFIKLIDPSDFQIEFFHDKKLYALGVNIGHRSISFLGITPEATIQYIYTELKTFLSKE